MTGFRAPGDIPTRRMSETPDGRYKGTRSPAASKHYGEGRTCCVCKRPLSRYNPDEWCAGCFEGVPLDQRPEVRNTL